MIAEVATGLSSAKALFDIAKGLQAAATQAQVNEVKIALQEHVLNVQAALAAAQAAESAASERVRELEQEIVKLKDWEREKQRYELIAIDAGAFAYMPKAGMENGEPAHWLCTNCFQDGQPSFLQFHHSVTGHGPAQDVYRCARCKAEVGVFFRVKPEWKRQ